MKKEERLIKEQDA